MSSISIAAVAFLCIFGGSLFGMYLRSKLKEHHLGSETKDVVKVGVGLIATMSALVLGLLVASAKSSFDTQKSEVGQIRYDRLIPIMPPQNLPHTWILEFAYIECEHREMLRCAGRSDRIDDRFRKILGKPQPF